jgi:hypothetical protein
MTMFDLCAVNMYYRYATLFAVIVYMYTRSLFHLRGRPLTDFDTIVHMIRTLTNIAGDTETSDVIRMMKRFRRVPSIDARSDIMNTVSCWLLRPSDRPDASDQRIADVVQRLNKWTLSMLTPDLTQYDAPRAYRPIDDTLDLYV